MSNLKNTKKLSGLDTVFGADKKEIPVEKNADESRATFQINNAVLEKIRAISYWERELLKDIIHTGLSDYIKQYEKKNGEIKPLPNKK